MDTPIQISIIAAVADNGAIGYQGKLPWERIAADMRFFKEITAGKPVVMGRGTWESIGRRPLPGRHNIVVTRQDVTETGALFLPSFDIALQCALDHARVLSIPEVMVIGGAQVYSQALPHASRMYLTRVHSTPRADTFFPLFPAGEWKMPGTPGAIDGSTPITFEMWDRVPAAMFRRGAVIRHRKGSFYRVEQTPADGLHLESTAERAYVYRSLSDDRVWVRGQAEMEDGRFEVVLEPVVGKRSSWQ